MLLLFTRSQVYRREAARPDERAPPPHAARRLAPCLGGVRPPTKPPPGAVYPPTTQRPRPHAHSHQHAMGISCLSTRGAQGPGWPPARGSCAEPPRPYHLDVYSSQQRLPHAPHIGEGDLVAATSVVAMSSLSPVLAQRPPPVRPSRVMSSLSPVLTRRPAPGATLTPL